MQWDTDEVRTAGPAYKLVLTADRNKLNANGKDFSFITVCVVDKNGVVVPEASNSIKFEVSGAGELVATDNGNPADLVSFASKERAAYSGYALAIVRTNSKAGTITVKANAEGLQGAEITILAH
jgi:beta-galactosidase